MTPSKPVVAFRELDIMKIEKMSRKELNAETAHCWREQVDLCAKIEFLTQRNQELELALLKYGSHDSGCVTLRIDDEFDAVRLCECGFSKALEGEIA